MKIRTGKLIDSDVICTHRVKIWTAAAWNLTNTNLSQELVDKAYLAAGVKPGTMYAHSTTVYGSGGSDRSTDWIFEVVIKKRVWQEVA